MKMKYHIREDVLKSPYAEVYSYEDLMEEHKYIGGNFLFLETEKSNDFEMYFVSSWREW